MTTAIQCPTFKPTLRVGNNGQNVKEMQKRLNQRFASIYTPALEIPVDGDFGSHTQAAVKYLQCLAFLPVNAITDATTWNFICNGAASLPTLSLIVPEMLFKLQLDTYASFTGAYWSM